jgi:hypothetical protein
MSEPLKLTILTPEREFLQWRSGRSINRKA